MTTVTGPSPADKQRRLAGLLARLRRDHAGADLVDLHSTLELLPTAEDLDAAFDDADDLLIARTPTGDTCGYGLTWRWVEGDDAQVHLLDVWAVPGPGQQSIEAELFNQLEAAVRGRRRTSHRAVLGANCRSTEPARMELLTRRGFLPAFDMIEMEAPSVRFPPASLPAGITIGSVTQDDATSIADLTSRVWAGRPYFTMPTLDDVHGWLARADPDLYLIAVHDTGTLVGLASAAIRPQCAEIDDVQVDPNWQRQGLATALLTELTDRLARRTTLPVRLHTEGHDPAGARSLYQRLGYTVTTKHHRLRKPL